MLLRYKLIIILLSAIMLVGCNKEMRDDPIGPKCNISLTATDYNPTPHTFVKPNPGFQFLLQPANNEATEEGIYLGRKLFYDPVLSKDSTMSCASCHLASASFTDQNAVSEGISGLTGTRSSMSLMNAGYHEPKLFWDGRAFTLEEQALQPVEDALELNHSWAAVEQILSCDSTYAVDFRRAFGISSSNEITKELVAKSIAQFERTLQSGSSRYDTIVYHLIGFFSTREQNGSDMFFDDLPDLPDAECFHCHIPPLFTNQEFMNNGIDSAANLFDFPDLGRGGVTGDSILNGKFIVPTLRNIALTAPYMHDGRFQTLEEVLDHYNSGGHGSPNKDPLIEPLGLTEEQKEDIIIFLHTLTDTFATKNPSYQSPF